jgi:biofilm PGA synthesis N-glycosyltransferase PgaC
MRSSLLIISPVRNEEAHIKRSARALASQTCPPDLWVVVDDGSEDGTSTLLEALRRELSFMRVVSTPAGYTRGVVDRHAVAAAPRAFNWALRGLDWRRFTHLGKLDGDIELPPDYFERLLRRFAEEPRLGIAGGALVEPAKTGWREDRVPQHHVRGALKLYSRECFEAIGGIQERLGWDTIDEVYARMLGFETRSFDDLVARHHRPVASADGLLRGHARFGHAMYVLHYSAAWVLLRSFKVAASRPFAISGASFLYGYLRAALRSEPQVDDADYRRFVRRELRDRLMGAPVRLGEMASRAWRADRRASAR